MKERMLTVLVPIKDSDAVVVNELPAINSDNINVIYKLGNTYKRIRENNEGNYEYVDVVDREFPYLGRPLEIFDFTYDATRMGPAPTISAQGVMWFADKDAGNNDVTLEDMWSQDCHVSFNGENFYLKNIPTSSKTNEDARYKYDLEFVSERVALENVYIYDVVQPFITEAPLSESSKFSFFGGVEELVKRINASLLRSGLSRLELRENKRWVLLSSIPDDWDTNWSKYYALVDGEYYNLSEIYVITPPFTPNAFYEYGHPRLLSDGETLAAQDQYFSYAEWCAIKLGTYDGPLSTADVYLNVTEFFDGSQREHRSIFDHYGGDYNAYLRNEVYQMDEDGNPIVRGYICRIGKDKKGETTTSEEKMVTFEDNTIYEAMQQIKDTYGLQYYAVSEKSSDGVFTGNTLIMVADCEHDFADMNLDGTDFVRDENGIPTTNFPFDYGVDNELLSKEKTNTTDKIVTRITGVGSSENIPWYYPNPTADGWIKPVYKRNGEELPLDIDYPKSEGNSTAEYVRYEKYLKNRLGNVFQYGNIKQKIVSFGYVPYIGSSVLTKIYSTSIDESSAEICYSFKLTKRSRIRVSAVNSYMPDETVVSYKLYNLSYQEITDESNAFLLNGGLGWLDAGTYHLVYILTFTTGPTVVDDVHWYFYDKVNTVYDGYQSLPIATFITALKSVFSGNSSFIANYPPFLSTNPNLHFVYSKNLNVLGWYDENDNRIDWDDVTLLDKNSEYYAFNGGRGEQTVGHDDIVKINTTDNKIDHIVDVDYVAKYYEDYRPINSPINALPYSINILSTEGLHARDYDSIIHDIDVSVDDFISEYWDLEIDVFDVDGWYLGSKRQDLSDYGLELDSQIEPDITDTIEFQRVKYVTPQPNLMPEVYIKTDGERRFYNAHNYYPLKDGVADTVIGEKQSGSAVVNPLYKEDELDADNKHYEFENEYMQRQPKEHIETFEDIKPSIKEQTNTIIINREERTLRIDVVEEFAYDEYDNDEVWESNDDGNVSGEYKHPYIFAKLRPLGFNLFDMALHEDMVISMTTGHCGACNFKIGVDENTKKNPVQIWEYDVYGGDTYATRGEKLYSAGDLRRWVDTSNLHYDTDGTEAGYVSVNYNTNAIRSGFFVGSGRQVSFEQTVYPSNMIIRGEVGTLKKSPRNHYQGDVKYSGRFIESQQDTSNHFVWVALMKDTDTYGTVMPSAHPDYSDGNFSSYIEPKGAHYYDRKLCEWHNLTDEEADKFVLVNIRFPQIYLRRAERKLSKALVKYMYEHNYQMFNFSIGFSRIFLSQNEEIEKNINENSVLYVSFNNRTYRQYVKHYTYRMSKDQVLPEISVDMNEELSVSRTLKEANYRRTRQMAIDNKTHIVEQIRNATDKLSRSMIGRNEDVVVNGNIVSRNAGISFLDASTSQHNNGMQIMQEAIRIDKSNTNMRNIVNRVNTFNTGVVSKMKQVRETLETRVIPALTEKVNEDCLGSNKYYFTPTIITQDNIALFWLTSEGAEQLYHTGLCPTNQGMTDLNWSNISITI